MITNAELGIRIVASGAESARAELNSVTGGVQRMGDTTSEVVSRMRGVLATVGFVALGREFVQAADAINLANARLQLATTGATEFAAAQADIYRIAQANNVGLLETTQLYSKLAVPIRELGGDTRTTSAIVESFAASLRLGGASAAEASSATLQFAQAMASGKLNGDEFRSLAEASPRFMRALADGVGVGTGALKEMASEGKLTADVVGNALISQLGRLQQEAQGLPDTVGGAMTRLRNEALLAVEAFEGLSGTTGKLSDFLGLAAGFVGELANALNGSLAGGVQNVRGEVDLATVAFGALGTIFETLIVVAANVGYVVKQVGNEIGGIAAQAVALASGDFDAVAAISREMKADAAAARQEIDRFSASVVGITGRVIAQRDAVRQGALATSEASAEMAKFGRQQDAVGASYSRLRTAAVASSEAATKEAKARETLAASYSRTVAASSQRIAQQALEADASRKLTKAEEEWIAIFAAVRDGKVTLARLEKDGTIERARANVEAERAQTIAREEAKALEAAAKAREKYFATLDGTTSSILDQANKQRQANLELEIGKDAVAALEVAQLRDNAARLQNIALIDEQMGGSSGLSERLRAQAAAWTELANAREAGVGQQAAAQTGASWARVSGEIGQSLTDSLFRAFEQGGNFFENLWDGIKNTIQSTALRVLIEPVQRRVAGVIGSFLGVPGTAAAGQESGGLGGIGNLLGQLPGLEQLTNFGGTGIAGLGAIFRAGVGQTLGGLSGTGLALENAGALLGGGQIGAGLAQAAGALGPYVAAAAALYSIAKRFEGGGTTSFGSVVEFDGSTAARTRFGDDSTITENINQDVDAALRGLTTASVGALNLVSEAFGAAGGFSAVAKFAADNDNASIGQFILAQNGNVAGFVGSQAPTSTTGGGDFARFAQDPGDGLAGFADAVAATTLDTLRAIDLPAWATDLIEQLSPTATLEEVSALATLLATQATQLSSIRSELSGLGGIFTIVGQLSGDALYELTQFAGGIEQFATKTRNFVSAYYTEAEQAAVQAASVRERLSDLGINADQFTTQAEFRGLVESTSVATSEGRARLAELLDIAQSFASVGQFLERTNSAENAVRQNLGSLAQMVPQTTAQLLLAPASAVAANDPVGPATTADPVVEAVDEMASRIVTEQAATIGALQTASAEQAEAMLVALREIQATMRDIGRVQEETAEDMRTGFAESINEVKGLTRVLSPAIQGDRFIVELAA